MRNHSWRRRYGAILLVAALSSACTSAGTGSSGSETDGSPPSTVGSMNALTGSGETASDSVATTTDRTSTATPVMPSAVVDASASAGSSAITDPSTSVTTPQVVVVLTAQTADGAEPDPADVELSADLLRDRVASVDGASVTVQPPGQITLRAPGDDVTIFDGLTRRGVLTLRPVVSSWVAPLAPGSSASGASSPISAAVASLPTTGPAGTATAAGFPPGSDPEMPTQPEANTPAGWKTWRATAQRYGTSAMPPPCDRIDRYQDLDDPDKPLLACGIDHDYGYLLDPTIINGSAISSATAAKGPNGVPGWVVNATFSINAQQAWATYTTGHVGQRVSLTLDGQVLSAPEIVQPITGGMVQINASFTKTEATELAQWLDAGALPLAFEVDSRDVVG